MFWKLRASKQLYHFVSPKIQPFGIGNPICQIISFDLSPGPKSASNASATWSDVGKCSPPNQRLKLLKKSVDPPPYPLLFLHLLSFKKQQKQGMEKQGFENCWKKDAKNQPPFVSCIKASSSSAKSLCSISGKPLTRSCATRRVVGRSSANFRNKGLEMMLSPE